MCVYKIFTPLAEEKNIYKIQTLLRKQNHHVESIGSKVKRPDLM